LSEKELPEKIRVNEIAVLDWEKSVRMLRWRSVLRLTEFLNSDEKKRLKVLSRIGDSYKVAIECSIGHKSNFFYSCMYCFRGKFSLLLKKVFI
jgi:hypothetical protein